MSNEISLATDWPWIIPPLAFLVWFVWFEGRAFNHPERTHTLSRFMAIIGAKFPLSIGLIMFGIGILFSHFWWHWGCDIANQGG